MMVIRLDLKIICVTKAVVPLTTEKKERKVYIPHRSKIYLHKSVRRIRSGMEQPTPKKERVPESDYFNVYIVVGILFHISGHVTVTFLLLI